MISIGLTCLRRFLGHIPCREEITATTTDLPLTQAVQKAASGQAPILPEVYRQLSVSGCPTSAKHVGCPSLVVWKLSLKTSSLGSGF